MVEILFLKPALPLTGSLFKFKNVEECRARAGSEQDDKRADFAESGMWDTREAMEINSDVIRDTTFYNIVVSIFEYIGATYV